VKFGIGGFEIRLLSASLKKAATRTGAIIPVYI
jgi:hypothetical protein